jgi:MFS transporter, DHA3 family, macrolide efflux protein
MASVPQFVPAEQLGRINGLLQLSQAMAQLVAPLLGGWLYVTINMPGIFLIDLVSFVLALALLLATRFPAHQPAASPEKRGLLAESWAAWRVLAGHRGLLAVTLLIVLGNFTVGSIEVLITPLVLSFAPPTSLGLLMTVGGGGMLVGSLALSTLGAPRRLAWGVIGAELLGATAMMLAGLSQHLGLLACAAFLYFFSLPFGSGCHLSLLQRNLDPALHGRVFALLGASASLALVAGYSSAGPLADYVFEPLLAPGGPLAATLGGLLGTGPGRGIGLLFLAMGGLTWLAAGAVALIGSVRRLHTDDGSLNV